MTADAAEAGYTPGGWVAIAGPSAWLLAALDPAAEPVVTACWHLLRDGAPVEDVLDAILSAGLRALPDFVLAALDGAGTRVVARGTAVARLIGPDGSRPVDSGGARTWADLEIDGVPEILELLAGHNAAPGAMLPLPSGVGMASALRVVFASDGSRPAQPHRPLPGGRGVVSVTEGPVRPPAGHAASAEPSPQSAEVEVEASNYDRLFGQTVHAAVDRMVFAADEDDPDDQPAARQAGPLPGGWPAGLPVEPEPPRLDTAGTAAGGGLPDPGNATAAGPAESIIDVFPWGPPPDNAAPPPGPGWRPARPDCRDRRELPAPERSGHRRAGDRACRGRRVGPGTRAGRGSRAGSRAPPDLTDRSTGRPLDAVGRGRRGVGQRAGRCRPGGSGARRGAHRSADRPACPAVLAGQRVLALLRQKHLRRLYHHLEIDPANTGRIYVHLTG
jgi:hypothetical protein